MPCSCDGYDIADKRAQINDLETKVEHLEKTLCNAQSLIHKLLRHITTLESCGAMELGAELRKRADEHIALLLKHKRAEAEADRAKAIGRREEMNRRLSNAEVEGHKLEQRHREERAAYELAKKRERELYQQAVSDASAPLPSDEELLG